MQKGNIAKLLLTGVVGGAVASEGMQSTSKLKEHLAQLIQRQHHRLIQ